MAPKKLTEADKTSILSLYRQPEETTSTLADRYGVSNSTISRLLKASLPEAEYSALIQQKRGAGDKVDSSGGQPSQAQPKDKKSAKAKSTKPKSTKPKSTKAETPKRVDTPQPASPAPEPQGSDSDSIDPVDKKASPVLKKQAAAAPEETTESSTATAETTSSQSNRRRRSRSATAKDAQAEDATQLTFPETDPATTEETPAESSPRPERPILKSASTKREEDDTPIDPVDSGWVDDDGRSPVLDDDYDDDYDDDEDDTETWEGDDTAATPHLEALEINPLTTQVLPSLCYLVVERSSSELVALPLRTFADLGQIPEDEGESRTLPVFDNHRVARRFSRRNQRVIKVPDGSLLQTASPYLQAKGITRLLIDGQVFALESQSN